MSTPVGQSDAQPLQDRQRSSASSTAGSAQAADQRAVERLLEHPGAAAGGVLLVAGGEVGGAHHAGGRSARRTCRRRCSGARRRRASRRRAGAAARCVTAARAGRAQVGVERRRVDQDAGVEQVVGVADRLDRAEERDRLLVVHQRQQLGAGPAVAVLAGERAAVARAAASAPAVRNSRKPGGRRRPGSNGEVDPHVHAAVAEVAVGHAVEAVLAQQVVEVAQPGAEVLGRDGGVLPAGVRRACAGCGRPARPRPRGSATARRPRRRR